MINILSMVGVFWGGIVLGLFFFGGLLWTVNRGLTAKYPALLFLASWLIRMGIVVGAFLLLFNGRWERLLVCVAGFLVARVVIFQFSRAEKIPGESIEEAGNAS